MEAKSDREAIAPVPWGIGREWRRARTDPADHARDLRNSFLETSPDESASHSLSKSATRAWARARASRSEKRMNSCRSIMPDPSRSSASNLCTATRRSIRRSISEGLHAREITRDGGTENACKRDHARWRHRECMQERSCEMAAPRMHAREITRDGGTENACKRDHARWRRYLLRRLKSVCGPCSRFLTKTTNLTQIRKAG